MRAAATSLSRTSALTKALAVTALAAAVVYIVAEQLPNSYWLRMIAKPIPVLCLALWVSTLPRRGRYQLAIAIGLLLSALGDILLEASEATFLFGLIAFLLGHVAYVVAFLQDSRELFPLRALAAYGYGVLAYFYLSSAGNLGTMAIPVALYVLVICTMLWRAASRIGVDGISPFSARAGLIGALFFAISDSVLSFGMFETPIQLGGVVVIVTYWIGQLGIALSALQD